MVLQLRYFSISWFIYENNQDVPRITGRVIAVQCYFVIFYKQDSSDVPGVISRLNFMQLPSFHVVLAVS